MLPGTLCVRKPLSAHSQGKKSPPASQREEHSGKHPGTREDGGPAPAGGEEGHLWSSSVYSPGVRQLHLSQVGNWVQWERCWWGEPKSQSLLISASLCRRGAPGWLWDMENFQFHPQEDELCTHTLHPEIQTSLQQQIPREIHGWQCVDTPVNIPASHRGRSTTSLSVPPVPHVPRD